MADDAGPEPPLFSAVHSVISSHLRKLEKVGQYFKGYIDGEENFEKFISDFSAISSNSYCIRRSTSRKLLSETKFDAANDGNGEEESGIKRVNTETISSEAAKTKADASVDESDKQKVKRYTSGGT